MGSAQSTLFHSLPPTTLPLGRVRRHITPDAGRGLEKLGHAIEYLTDEVVHRGGELSSHADDLEAIKRLMMLSQSVYFACEIVPPLSERLRSAFQRMRS